jgi:heme exporter protein B
MIEAVRAIFLRDLKIAFRIGGGAGIGVVFFLALVTVVPFAVGPEMPLLSSCGLRARSARNAP